MRKPLGEAGRDCLLSEAWREDEGGLLGLQLLDLPHFLPARSKASQPSTSLWLWETSIPAHTASLEVGRQQAF